MTEAGILAIAQHAVMMMVMLAGPLLLVSLVVGLLVSVFQAVTQINEMTLTFVPKVVAIFVVLLLMGPWMLQMLLGYTASTFTSIAQIGH
ncbi:MAG TPA: flagellar biosynthesis protein FliQ [Chloroflexota bacterium]|nr:flagellar biosynthesis protein FliQ [Chloroflexota bacterium]